MVSCEEYFKQITSRKRGATPYDVVVALDEQKIENIVQFRKYLYEKKTRGYHSINCLSEW